MDATRANELLLAELDENLRRRLATTLHCAQASFAVLDEHFALGGAAVQRALAPMPGIALRGQTCGALTGPLLALGLVFGGDRPGDETTLVNALPAAREFCRQFEAEVGSTNCAQILEDRLGRPFDLSRQADFAAYQQCGGPESCTAVIRAAVRLAAVIILEGRQSADDPGVLLTA